MFVYKNSQYKCLRARKAFTLIELLVVIAIISLLVSILLPSLNRAKELAKQVLCATNERSIGQAIALYANDYDGWLVAHIADYNGYDTWNRVLAKENYVDAIVAPDGGTDFLLAPAPGSVFACPSETDPMPAIGWWFECNYGMNCFASFGPSRFQVENFPLDFYYIADSGDGGWNPITLGPPVSSTVRSRHYDGWNVMFIDSRVEYRTDDPIEASYPADGEAPWNLPDFPGCWDGTSLRF